MSAQATTPTWASGTVRMPGSSRTSRGACTNVSTITLNATSSMTAGQNHRGPAASRRVCTNASNTRSPVATPESPAYWRSVGSHVHKRQEIRSGVNA